MLDRKPAALAVSIKKDTDWERWIPNTGEYYSFKLDVRVLNAGGYAIKAENILDSNTFVRIDPPVDRKIDSSLQFADASNILKNNGTGFELVIEPENGFDKQKAILVARYKLENGVYKPDYTGSELYDFYGLPLSDDINKRLSISGNKVYYDTRECSFGIRPLNKNICPGDDIYLSIGIYHNLKTGSFLFGSLSSTCAEKDYLAVYDKKMLWRANLYLYDYEDTDHKTPDWNITHPWNAPPEPINIGKSIPVGGVPAWWDESWGYNEWNRLSVDLKLYKYLWDLPASDGKQVIHTQSYTPIRPVYKVKRSNNMIWGRVAYSYPWESDWRDGHFDSPFDFKKKLITEMISTAYYYSFNSNEFIQNGQTVKGDPVYSQNNRMLSSWSLTTAPGNVWGYYLNKNFMIGSTHYKTFIPSMGLLQAGSDFNTDVFGKDVVVGNDPQFVYGKRAAEDTADNTQSYPAGTDCLGLAQRSMSWSGNKYVWRNLSGGWAEGGGLSPGADNRHYPRCIMASGGADPWFKEKEPYYTASSEICTITPLKGVGDILSNKDSNLSEYNKLSCVVPGDIWYTNTSAMTHIAIVSDVTYDEDGNISNIFLIEATFSTGKVVNPQYVLKTNDLILNYTNKTYRLVRIGVEKEGL